MGSSDAPNQMALVHVKQTTRPTKFFFLVSLQDTEMIERVARMNTVLWGGMFNPITPVEQGCKSVIEAFHASHADFLVNTIGDSAPREVRSEVGRRLIPLEGWNGLIAAESGSHKFQRGCDMLPLYEYYYHEEGRHSHPDSPRQPIALITGSSPDWQRYAVFQSGLFPDSFGHNFEQVYCASTRAQRVVLDDQSIRATQWHSLRTPLEFTCSKVDFGSRSPWPSADSHVIFIGKWESYADWVEFWNLRCFGSDIVFVQHDRLDLFNGSIAEYLEAGNYPLDPNNDRARNRAVVQKSSTLTQEQFDVVTQQIAAAHKGDAWSVRGFLPKFGLERAEQPGGAYGPPPLEAPIGHCEEREEIGFISGGWIEFRVVAPMWFKNRALEDGRSWSVALRSWGNRSDDVCFRYPGLRSVDDALQERNMGGRDLRVSPRENVVYQFGGRPFQETDSFSPMTSFEMFKAVLHQFGVKLVGLSEKGQYATRMEEAMAYNVALLRDKGVHVLLARLAGESTEANLPRRELEKILGDHSPLVHNPEKPLYPAEIVNMLIEHKVLRPGLELKCQHCYKLGWYHVSEFDEDFNCRYCFNRQPARLHERLDWRYKSSGLFATKGVGYGSLAVISTALFLRQSVLDWDDKRLYSSVLEFPDQETREIDLAALHIDWYGRFRLAVCECKTSDFEESDFARLARVAGQIPRSVACVATFKAQFSEKEKEEARKFWDQRLPLIMLAERELRSGTLPTDALPDRLQYSRDFEGLAEATRCLYLS